jgi:hypothetical protein
MSTRRSRIHIPLDRGYIHCSDIWHTRIFYIDCTAGGAQQVFEELCFQFRRAGWDIGNRSFDFRIIRRNGISWHLSILGHLPPHDRFAVMVEAPA